MKKLYMLLLVVILVLAMSLTGISCKKEVAPAEETTEEAAEETTEEAAEETTEEVATEEEVPVDGGELHFGRPTTFQSLNILDASAGGRVFWYTFQPLINFSVEHELTPCLAESWEISSGGLEYTFHLRKDVLWQDGEQFDADDVVFTFNYFLNPIINSPNIGFFSLIEGYEEYINGEADSIAGITKIDDYTVKFKLSKFSIFFLYDFTGHGGYIIPEHVVGKIAPEDYIESDFATKGKGLYPGTGPYIFESYVPEQYVELTKNINYWGGVPHIEKIYLNVFQDASSMTIALEKGEIDIVFDQLDSDIEYFSNLPDFEIREAAGGPYKYIGFNVGPKGTIPLLVRQAINYAIDKDVLVDKILKGKAKAEISHITSNEWAISPNLNPYEYNPEKAKSLLEEAGWDYEKEIDFWITPWFVEEPVIPVIQKMLQDIGLKIKITPIDLDTFMQVILKDHDYEMFFVAGAGGGYDPHPNVLYYHTNIDINKGYNYADINNPEVDALMDEGISLETIEERQPIYWKIGEILNYEVPSIPLYTNLSNVVYNKRLKNVQWGIWGDEVIHEWYISE